MAKAKKLERPARESTRYSARVRQPSGRIQEIGIGTDPAEMIALAKKHHAEHGWNVWVWNVRTGEPVFGISGAALVQKAGAQ